MTVGAEVPDAGVPSGLMYASGVPACICDVVRPSPPVDSSIADCPANPPELLPIASTLP